MNPINDLVKLKRWLFLIFLSASLFYTIIITLSYLNGGEAAHCDTYLFYKVCYNIWVGKGFEAVLEFPPVGVFNHFGFHFSPILAFISPFVALLNTPLSILIIRILCFTITAYLAYKVALLKLDSLGKATLIPMVLFLFSPMILFVINLYWHEVEIALPIVMYIVYLVEGNFSPFKFTLSLIFLLSIKEEFAAFLPFLGAWLYLRLGKRYLIPALFMMFLGPVLFYFELSLIKLLHREYGFEPHYPQGLKALIVRFFNNLRNVDFLIKKFVRIFAGLASWGFLPFFYLKDLLPLSFFIFGNLAFEEMRFADPRWHYWLPYLPFLYIASLNGVVWLKERVNLRSLRIILVIVLLFFASTHLTIQGISRYSLVPLFKSVEVRDVKLLTKGLSESGFFSKGVLLAPVKLISYAAEGINESGGRRLFAIEEFASRRLFPDPDVKEILLLLPLKSPYDIAETEEHLLIYVDFSKRLHSLIVKLRDSEFLYKYRDSLLILSSVPVEIRDLRKIDRAEFMRHLDFILNAPSGRNFWRVAPLHGLREWIFSRFK